MNVYNAMWEHIKATQNERLAPAPPRATDVWQDLNRAHNLIHAQSIAIGDLQEAVDYLADVITGLRNRLTQLEEEKQ